MLKVFNLNGYRSLIKSALEKEYSFILFDEIKDHASGKFCLFRHDIDTDLEAAKQMALVEQEMNIRATYFLMLRSPVYNVFGRHNHRCVEAILNAGHRIALHYDEAFYPDNGKELQELVETEAEVLGKMFGQKITTVSFHQPGPKVLTNEVKLTNFINTYSKSDMDGIFYISDSNMVWKNKTAWDLFESETEKKIQLLTHPMWWMGSGNENTEMLWNKSLLDNASRTLKQIIETEGAFGTPRGLEIKVK